MTAKDGIFPNGQGTPDKHYIQGEAVGPAGDGRYRTIDGICGSNASGEVPDASKSVADRTAESVYTFDGSKPHGTRMDRMAALGQITAHAQSPDNDEAFIDGNTAKGWSKTPAKSADNDWINGQGNGFPGLGNSWLGYSGLP